MKIEEKEHHEVNLEDAQFLDKFGATAMPGGLVLFKMVDIDGNETTLLATSGAVANVITALGDALGEDYWDEQRERIRKGKSDVGQPN